MKRRSFLSTVAGLMLGGAAVMRSLVVPKWRNWLAEHKLEQDPEVLQAKLRRALATTVFRPPLKQPNGTYYFLSLNNKK